MTRRGTVSPPALRDIRQRLRVTGEGKYAAWKFFLGLAPDLAFSVGQKLILMTVCTSTHRKTCEGRIVIKRRLIEGFYSLPRAKAATLLKWLLPSADFDAIDVRPAHVAPLNAGTGPSSSTSPALENFIIRPHWFASNLFFYFVHYFTDDVSSFFGCPH